MIKRNLNKTKTLINEMSADVSYAEKIWKSIWLIKKENAGYCDPDRDSFQSSDVRGWPLYGGPGSVDPGAEIVSSVLEAGAPDHQTVVPHHGDGAVLHSSKPGQELLGEKISQNKRWEHSAAPLGNNNHLSVSSKRSKKEKMFLLCSIFETTFK